MKAIDILVQKRVIGTYRTKIRLAVNCMFFEAFGTINPIARETPTGFELWLKDGSRYGVNSDFMVTVYEVAGGWK